MNLFLHPFIFVMSLVLPVLEMKGNLLSVKEAHCVSLQLKNTAHIHSTLQNSARIATLQTHEIVILLSLLKDTVFSLPKNFAAIVASNGYPLGNKIETIINHFLWC